MPQSLSQVLVHMVYSTKNRADWLTPEIQPRLFAYLSTVLHNKGNVPVIVGGHVNHVHLLFGLSRTMTIAQVVESTKTSTSAWVKGEFGNREFAWQHGYGAFSVSPNDEKAVIAYIASQNSHHEVFNFQDEYRRLLQEHGIAYNEKYVWD